MTKKPIREIPFYRPSIGREEIEAVTGCLRSGWLTTGPESMAFEREFAEYVGMGRAVAVNSCTAALHVSLGALGIGPGDLVIVPTMTFAATALVVHQLGATPVFVDCEPETLCMDPRSLEAAAEAAAGGKPWPGFPGGLRGRLRAVIPVHYGGQMADVQAIRRTADRFGLRIVDDAAHALPAFARDGRQWRMVGWGADIACFSFYPNKPITTAEGGMACTDDEDLAERMLRLRLHGISRDAWNRYSREGSWTYDVVDPGYKYNMPDLCAAIGRVQLKKADRLWSGRRRAAGLLDEVLEPFESILHRPVERPDRKHSWHLYVVRIDPGSGIERDEFIESLRRRGIVTGVHYRPLHEHSWFRRTWGFRPGDFPVAHEAWKRLVSLPIYPDMSEEEVAFLGEAVRAAIRDCVRSGA